MEIKNVNTWYIIKKTLNDLDIFYDKFIIEYLEKNKGIRKYENSVFVLCYDNQKRGYIYSIQPRNNGWGKTAIDISVNHIKGFLHFKNKVLHYYPIYENGRINENDFSTVEEVIIKNFMKCDLLSETFLELISERSDTFTSKLLEHAIKKEEFLNKILERPYLLEYGKPSLIDKLTKCEWETFRGDEEEWEKKDKETDNLFYSILKKTYEEYINRCFSLKDTDYLEKIVWIKETCLGYYLIKKYIKKN